MFLVFLSFLMSPMFVLLFSLYDVEDWGGIGNSREGVWSVTWSPLTHKREGGQWTMPSLFPVKALREHSQLTRSRLSPAPWEDL